jgi:hypothetical protein
MSQCTLTQHNNKKKLLLSFSLYFWRVYITNPFQFKSIIFYLKRIFIVFMETFWSVETKLYCDHCIFQGTLDVRQEISSASVYNDLSSLVVMRTYFHVSVYNYFTLIIKDNFYIVIETRAHGITKEYFQMIWMLPF